MSKKNISVWLIIPQTNLHVGNESVVSFGVIDKAIQRDAATNIPCINSSSLKGAIKEHLTNEKPENINIMDVFGSVKSGKVNDTRKGSAVFFDANLLFIPNQCAGKTTTYELVYNKGVVEAFVAKANLLGADCTVEQIKSKLTGEPLSDDAGKSESEQFNTLCQDDALPIIARNCLDNGESVNLWYEQILPSHSVLATMIQTKAENELDYLNGKVVQIGANATIGYGYCKFVKL